MGLEGLLEGVFWSSFGKPYKAILSRFVRYFLRMFYIFFNVFSVFSKALRVLIRPLGAL